MAIFFISLSKRFRSDCKEGFKLNYILHYDICAITIYLVTIFIFYFKKNIPSFRNRVFGGLLWASFLSAFFDVMSVVVGAHTTVSIGIRMFFHVGYYVFHLATPFLFSLYTVMLADTPKTLRIREKLSIIVPVTITLAVIVTTPFTQALFMIDEQGIYHRGPFQAICYICGVYYLLYGVGFTHKHRDMVTKQIAYSVYSFVVISIVPMLIQVWYPMYLLECFGASICILLILLTLHNNDDLVDSVTKMLNRAGFVNTAILNFKNDASFCVVIVRIADMDMLIKTLGVKAGHTIDYEFAQFLSGFVKFGNGYYLGDECFALVFDSNLEQVESVTDKIIARTQSPWLVDSMSISVSVRVCPIYCPLNANGIEELFDYIENIKELCSEEKLINVDDISICNKKREADVVHAINNGLAENGFEVYYQPIYSVEEGGVISAEALLRLYDETLGFIPPDEFIPTAERNGSIIKIGELVFESVCRFIFSHELDKLGLKYIEINLSVVQCMQTELVERLTETMRRYGITPEKICLEITETAASYSPEIMRENINKLTERGIAFAMDDYGTGYSNINCMLSLPFSYIKLDKSLVWSAFATDKARIAIESTIAMVKRLNMKIIAEGVETEEQARYLAKIGCDHLQGYYFSKPLPAENFLQIITSRQKAPVASVS